VAHTQEYPRVLILSLSGRALAQAAARSGYTVAVLDCFADTDTVATASAVWRADGNARGFDLTSLKQQIAYIGDRTGERIMVLGSGFEHCPEHLSALTHGWCLYGNTAESIRELKDWRRFFGLLGRLVIPPPPVTTVLPGQGWLRKSGHGSGGWQVRIADTVSSALAADEYYQRRQPGRVLSAVFLGDGQEALMVGYSEQFPVRVAACPYVYAGAVSLPAQDQNWTRTVAAWTMQLVAATGLRGLCGLDFILDPQGRPWLLEVNPRPPASFELHDPPGRGLFTAHIEACQGRLSSLQPRAGSCRAHAVLYAARPVNIAAHFRWPEWVCDRPSSGTTIREGQPICSTWAQAEDAGKARRLACRRRREIAARLLSTTQNNT